MFVARSALEPYYRDKKKLDADLGLIADSSPEDDRLFSWLSTDEEVWPALAPVFERRMGTRKGFEAWLLEADHRRFQLTPEHQRIGAYFAIVELREYSGHTLWNRFGKVPHYEDIIKTVHNRVSQRFGASLRAEMSVEDRELSLSAMILRESLEQLSPEKVSELLREANFESTSDYQELRAGMLRKLSSSGTSSLKSMLGKKVASRFGARLIESAFGASQLANAGRLGGIAARVLPFAVRRAGLYLSLGILMKDAYQLGGEATRVTNPAVIIIALYRSFSGR